MNGGPRWCRVVCRAARCCKSAAHALLGRFDSSWIVHPSLAQSASSGSVSSVVIEYELGIRKAVGKINRVAAGHHLVLITIRHQHRVMNARQPSIAERRLVLFCATCGTQRRSRHPATNSAVS